MYITVYSLCYRTIVVVMTLGSIITAGYFIYMRLDVILFTLTSNNDVKPFIQ